MMSKTCWVDRVKPIGLMNLTNPFRESVGPITKLDKSVNLLNPYIGSVSLKTCLICELVDLNSVCLNL